MTEQEQTRDQGRPRTQIALPTTPAGQFMLAYLAAFNALTPAALTSFVTTLCWPLGSSEPVRARVMYATRPPRVFFEAVVSGHWLSLHLSPAVHAYPRCCILMRQA